MAIYEQHRFLSGKTPFTIDKRVLVMGGQVHDIFYYNIYHGCKNAIDTFKLWAFENNIELIVFINRYGQFTFDSLNGEEHGRGLFEGNITRRRPKRGNSFDGNRNNNSNSNETIAEVQREREEAIAAATQESAGGSGQIIINNFKKLNQIIQSQSVSTLVILEDFYYFYCSLLEDESKIVAAKEIKNMLQIDLRKISNSNIVTFINNTNENHNGIISQIFQGGEFEMAEYIKVEGPKEDEIEKSLTRSAMKNDYSISGIKSICSYLKNNENLRLNMNIVSKIINSGINDIKLKDIMRLPEVNISEVKKIKDDINKLAGLEEVKAMVNKVENVASDFRRRLESGLNEIPEQTLHMVFTGNPGTGKTTVAKLFAKLFNALGFLQTSNVLEITAGDIISSDIGGTQENMRARLEESIGGVLFIDEAHQFGEDKPQSREAINTLVPFIWNHRSDMVVILAGYQDKMRNFYAMDPGLDRRFPLSQRINFEDYTLSELMLIFNNKIKKLGYKVEERERKRVEGVLKKRSRSKSFGNAGGVENLVQEIINNHSNSENRESDTITMNDLPELIRRDEKILDDAFNKLNNMIGQDNIKNNINAIINDIQYDLKREESSSYSGEVEVTPRNMLFVGPPGTGKTTVGHIIGKIFYGLGCIEKPTCCVVTRGDLVGSYQGHTSQMVRDAVDKARGGVLVIDEAYSLVNSNQDSFGKEAVDELVAQITNPQNFDTVFVLAGYKNDIMKFLDINEGLKSRFPQIIEFNSFTAKDCLDLTKIILNGKNFILDDGVEEAIEQEATIAIREEKDKFGNGRWVNTQLIPKILSNLKERVIKADISAEDEQFNTILVNDIPNNENRVNINNFTNANKVEWTAMEGNESLYTTNYNIKSLEEEDISPIIKAAAYQIKTTGKEEGVYGSATGFFVTPDGVMATNAHVIEGASKIVVVIDGYEHEADIIDYDINSDLAIIKVREIDNCDYLPLGESYNVPELRKLFVFGNAYVNIGEPGRIVVAQISRNNHLDSIFIEASGAIEEGFSGGPALDKIQGAVIGIVHGGAGATVKYLIRSEQLKVMLTKVGYRFR